MIFDNQRPRGEDPAIIILHAKIPHRRSNFLNLDDVTLGDHRLVFEAALDLCNPICNDSLYAALSPRTPKAVESLPVTFPIRSG
jgi:hypothetical protein